MAKFKFWKLHGNFNPLRIIKKKKKYNEIELYFYTKILLTI